MGIEAQSNENVSIKSLILALFSYLGILCLVPVIVNKTDEYINFHARQGIVLWVWSVFAIFAHYLPVIGYFIFVVSAFAIVLSSIYGLVSVASSKQWKIPLIYQISKMM